MAGLNLAFASPAATVLEFSLGANPLLRDLVEQPISCDDGVISAPTRPGLGVTPRADFIEQFRVKG
jgi:L-alanine-DL-glutamate epimerase-like enolase superfamily enzyme